MDDNILIDKFLSGDKEGFEMLVKKYQNHVVNIVYSLAGRISEAEDIAQDIFMKVYNNLSSFNRKAQFSTWLYRISVNTTYSHLRGRKQFVPLENIKRENSIGKNSREQLESKEKSEIIKKAIAELPFKFRSVLVLKEIEGLSYKDIAKTLGCRIGTVESRLFRAREMLKSKLIPIYSEGGQK
ncbi:MAG: sigma-70 family RNA polymerase sigma factor [Candidatus Omnitrophica bacterium]|nr:sigma-70 family RNA polymerase sigma factor [Candidatus Omnitrophota bacterium]